MRLLFCEEGGKGGTPSKKGLEVLCGGAAKGVGRREAHRENGRVVFYPRRNGSLRSSTVIKLLIALLAMGLLVGWKLRQRIGKRAGAQDDDGCESSFTVDVGVSRTGASSARRRKALKRARDVHPSS